QALYRRLSRAQGRGLCRGRSAKRRVRRLSCLRRYEQALSLQDQGAKFPPSRCHGLLMQGTYACRRLRRARLDRHCVRRDRPVREGKMMKTLVTLACTALLFTFAEARAGWVQLPREKEEA